MVVRMKQKDAAEVAALLKAVEMVPKVKRALSDAPGKYHEATWLELSGAEMQDGEGQGANVYLYLPPKVGRSVLDAAGNAIRKRLAELGVEVS